MIFPNIEYYIEYIAGKRDIKGTPTWFSANPPIALATYDVSFVESVADQTMGGTAMTDRQAALAERLIEKYAKQLRKHGVEQPDHKTYKLGPRAIDRSSSLTRKDDLAYIRFPYDEQKIQTVKTFCSTAQGRVFWSKDDKAWCFGLTEYNISWAVTFAQAHKIYVEPEIQELFDLVIAAEQTPYAIELRLTDDKQFYIENAPESLTEYITAHIGYDNIYSLVDSAGVLGYTVSKEISDGMVATHNDAFMKLCAGKSIDLTPSSNKYTMSDVIDWALAVDRLPIVVYNPNFLTPNIAEFQKYFRDDEIQIVTMKDTGTIDSNAKVIYTSKVLNDWQGRMPLLITYANLMHSTTKKEFMSIAEKIVYYCETLPKR